MYCQKCGSKTNENNAKFCSKCGEKIKNKSSVNDSVVNKSEINSSADSDMKFSISDSVISRSTITNIGKVVLEKNKIDASVIVEKAEKLAAKGRISKIFKELDKAAEGSEDEGLLMLRNSAYLSQKDLRTFSFDEGFKAEEYLLELFEISETHQENLILFILFRNNHYATKGMNHPTDTDTEELYDLLEMSEIPSLIRKNIRCSEESLNHLKSYF